MERDPRVDPRPGDVLVGPNGRFRVTGIHDEHVSVQVRRMRMQWSLSMARYLPWAKSATIIKRGDTP